MDSVTANTLYRIDVNFKIKKKNIDSLIGRSAHIQFLDNPTYMKMLINTYGEFFS